MASGVLNLNLRCNLTLRASCSSEERNHGMPTMKDNIVISDSQLSGNHKHPPLVNALKASAEQKVASFHFPGHNRGRAAPSSLTRLIGVQPFLHDLPELPELDNLFAPEGPILDAQKQAAKLFGAKETWFLVGGTTCGIQASILATCSPGDTIIIPRNAHISAFSAMVLSGVVPKYIIPEYDFEWDIACGITPSQVENAINESNTEGRKASAVLITSPTYHGICSNLEQISQICHSHNIPIIVDEAHGAHLGFHPHLPPSALSQRVDLSVQSTHKVLCSLTQSSMLHMSGNIINRERICQCLQTLQTTSPSYLLLASLDAARAQISENPETVFNKPVEIAMEARSLIEKIPGIRIFDSSTFGLDPLRITVGMWDLGISGFEADDILYEDYGVVSELTGTRSITFAINLGTRRDDVLRLVSGLRHLSQTHSFSGRLNNERFNDMVIKSCVGTDSGMQLSPREAFFACKTKVSFNESVGKICGELVCPYPPGIPLLIPGEVITEEALSYLVNVKNNGGFVSGAADSSLSTIIVCS
ncbi:putative arginine decarboxylase [Helianthus annuus]|nr:putative arginine decarboxylase [Helianthus annuus]